MNRLFSQEESQVHMHTIDLTKHLVPGVLPNISFLPTSLLQRVRMCRDLFLNKMGGVGIGIKIQIRRAHRMDDMIRSLHLGQAKLSFSTNQILTLMNLQAFGWNGNPQDILSSKEICRETI